MYYTVDRKFETISKCILRTISVKFRSKRSKVRTNLIFIVQEQCVKLTKSFFLVRCTKSNRIGRSVAARKYSYKNREAYNIFIRTCVNNTCLRKIVSTRYPPVLAVWQKRIATRLPIYFTVRHPRE